MDVDVLNPRHEDYPWMFYPMRSPRILSCRKVD
jgi:hypothetical protein